MARGKVFTNRKQTLDVGEEKTKKSTQVKRKEKKAASKETDGHPKGGGDYFDPKTGVVFSTRPEDSCIPLMEANITKFLKEQGELERPEDHVTVALHVIDYLSSDTPTNKPLVSTLPPITSQDLLGGGDNMATTNNNIPVTFWQEVNDSKTNHSYYWNPNTNEVTWTLPPNAVLTSEASERSDAIQDPENETLTNGTTGVTSASVQPSVVGKVVSKENQDSTTMVTNRVEEIAQKIQFLINENVNDVHAMKITFQTRATDWKEGGMNSKYFVSKLEDTEQEIESLVKEKIATHKWDPYWDRDTGRFYFKNKTSGRSQWEWPNPDTLEDETQSEDTTTFPASTTTDQMSTVVQEETPINIETTPPVTPPIIEEDDMDIDSNSDDNQSVEEHTYNIPIHQPNTGPIQQATTGPAIQQPIQQPATGPTIQQPMEQSATLPTRQPFNDPIIQQQVIEQSTVAEIKEEEDQSVVVGGDLYSDIPPLGTTSLNEGAGTEEEGDQMILTELEAANQEALLRARLLEKMKNNTPLEGEESALAAEMNWKPPPPCNEQITMTTETPPPSNEPVTKIPETPPPSKEQVTTTTEAPPLGDKYTKQDTHEEKKGRKSKRKNYDSDSDLSDDYRYSQRRRSRDRHTSSSHTSSSRRKKSYKYSDDSDNDDRRYSSSSRRRSRSKGRSSRRSKKDHRSSKKKYYRDSSPSDDDRRRRKYRSSDDERDKKRKHRHHSSSDNDVHKRNITPPKKSVTPPTKVVEAPPSYIEPVAPPTTVVAPPPLEKSFVPARFKPKGKNIEEDNNGHMLSQTQVEMIHNIASATGYPMMYTSPTVSQYNTVYTTGAYYTTEQYIPPATEQYIPPATEQYIPPVSEYTPATEQSPYIPPAVSEQNIPPAVSEYIPAVSNIETITTESVPVPTPDIADTVVIATDTTDTVVIATDNTPSIHPINDVSNNETVTTEQPLETEIFPMPTSDTPTTNITPTSDTPTTVAPTNITPTTAIEETPPTSDTPTTIKTPTTIERDVTPPLQDIPPPTQQQSTGYTISAPSTSYPSTSGGYTVGQYPTSGYTSDQYAAAYASMAAAYNPFYAQMYGGGGSGADSTQYAAAMNYYAAYQAAAYGAYYQQAPPPSTTQPNEQKK